MAKQPYLSKNKNGNYIYRRRVPDELIKIIGKREIKHSLKTHNYQEAAEMARVHATNDDALFNKERKRMQQKAKDAPKQLSEQELHYMALEWFKTNETANCEQDINFFHEANEFDKEVALDIAEADVGTSYENDDESSNIIAARGQAQKLFKENNISVEDNLEAFLKLSILIKRGNVELATRTLERLNGQIADKSFDPLFKDVYAHSSLVEPQTSITLEKAAKSYLDEGIRTGLNPKTQRLRQNTLDLLMEIFGKNKPITDINRENCRQYLGIIEQFPANGTKKLGKKLYKAMISIANKNNMKRISTKTVQQRMNVLIAFFNFAIDEGFLQNNPARKLAPTIKTSAKAERDAFTAEQLNKIFHAPLYTGCKDDGHGYDTTGSNIIRRGRFWIPLIALYTGMRLNEICQLFTGDIQQINNIHVFKIQLDSDNTKRLKTLSSARTIPINNELIKIGFLDYVDKIKKANNTQLFPDIVINADGYHSKYFSSWFQNFLKKSGAKTPKTNFHSFRHSFNDALKKARISKEHTKLICGWSGTEMYDRYGSDELVEILHTDINKAEYKDLDLSHLYI